MKTELRPWLGPLIAGIAALIVVGGIYARALYIHEGEFLMVDIKFGLPRILLISVVTGILCVASRRLSLIKNAVIGGVVGLVLAIGYVMIAGI